MVSIAPDTDKDRLELWKLEDGSHATRVPRVELDKPALVAMMGAGATGAVPPERVEKNFNYRIQSYVNGGGIKAEDCNLYVVVLPHCVDAVQQEQLEQYKKQPQAYTSAEAHALVNQMLDIPVVSGQRHGREAAVASLKKQLSKLNFFGYCYGALFTQMVRNALNDTLEKKGYRPEEIREALTCATALNVGPMCTAEDKSADFIQMFGISKKDSKYLGLGKFNGSDYAELDDYIEYKPLQNALVLRTDGKRHIFAIKFHPLDTTQEPLFPPASRLKFHDDGAPVIQWETFDGGQYGAGHALDRYMNIHQIFKGGEGSILSFQTDPCAHLHREFLTHALESSRQEERSGRDVLQQITAHSLPQTKDIMQRLEPTNELYHQISMMIRNEESADIGLRPAG